MSAVLVHEDGTGVADANSYATVAQADAFHEASPHSADWPADEESKVKLLITATRILDQQFRWYGQKATAEQALQWPRSCVPDPDRAGGRDYMPSDEVPRAVRDAVSSFALALLATDFEAAPSGEGLRSFELKNVMEVHFDLSTRPDFVPDWVRSELSKYGRLYTAGTGSVKLRRV